jgi:NADH-quinone oxidoreductase subunit F
LSDERQRVPKTIVVSSGTCGQAGGSLGVVKAFREELEKPGARGTVRLRVTGCQGFCEQEPLALVEPSGALYCRIKAEDVPAIVRDVLGKEAVPEKLRYKDPVAGESVRLEKDVPFYRAQDRTLLGQNKLVDPCRLEDYVAVGGYASLVKVLTTMKPEEVIRTIKAAGLRGRGGGGFPTGVKWESCRNAHGSPKYVICNADEGDPGAYMDRAVLEGNPHAVLEGMIIGAYAIGARHGFVYVRNEYPLAVTHTKLAVQQAEEVGLLGENILGTGFSFDVRIARGGGAFICGESTALMASLEGKVGEPRPKDIHTVEQGYLDLPSNLNNVETWANVPLIIEHGAAWFAAKGTEGSKGTKIFALTGRVKNTGLVEVAMGTPLRTIIYDIGGGASDGSEVKAVQTGGPSGGCLPADKFGLPVDFDALTDAGSMMGSGGMVVMDQRTCMVDVARYFLNFLQDESCGKCVPCRIGIDRMLEILADITEGRGTREQLALLEETADTVCVASLCALGKTAPNPVLSTLRYFREEWEAHVDEKRCPAGVCRALIRYSIDAQNCNGCTLCAKACPHEAIAGEKKKLHVIDQEKCQRCGICMDECNRDAVRVQ